MLAQNTFWICCPMNQRVPFGGRRPLDPRRTNISIDGNVLNRGGSEEGDRRIDRLLSLSSEGAINFVIAGGIRDEVLHPATPKEKKAVVLPKMFNMRPGRNSQQNADRQAVAAILQGNAKPETHAADASHLSEAAETGCAYFLTGDARIIRKRAELVPVLPPTLQIVTLEEFLEIYDGYVSGEYV
jgi:hypothetical protein